MAVARRGSLLQGFNQGFIKLIRQIYDKSRI